MTTDPDESATAKSLPDKPAFYPLPWNGKAPMLTKQFPIIEKQISTCQKKTHGHRLKNVEKVLLHNCHNNQILAILALFQN